MPSSCRLSFIIPEKVTLSISISLTLSTIYQSGFAIPDAVKKALEGDGTAPPESVAGFFNNRKPSPRGAAPHRNLERQTTNTHPMRCNQSREFYRLHRRKHKTRFPPSGNPLAVGGAEQSFCRRYIYGAYFQFHQCCSILRDLISPLMRRCKRNVVMFPRLDVITSSSQKHKHRVNQSSHKCICIFMECQVF